MKRITENRCLHFDLSHCPQDVEFTLLSGGKKHPLTAYKDAPGKFKEHCEMNKALSLIPQEHQLCITHFVEDAEMPANKAIVNRVVYPSIDDHPLPEIANMFIHIPQQHIERAVRIHKATKGALAHPLALSHYGVTPDAIAVADSDDVHYSAPSIKPPSVTAQTLVFYHPEIGTVNGPVAHTVINNYISSGINFANLVQFIQNNGPGTDSQWYNKDWSKWSTDPSGSIDKGFEPVPVNTDLTYKDGKKITDWPIATGQSYQGIPIYNITDEYDPPVKSGSTTDTLTAAAGPCVREVLQLTKADTSLNGQLWTAQTGVTNKAQTKVAPVATTPTPLARAVRTAVAGTGPVCGSGTGFGIKNTTSSYGLYLYEDELCWDFDKQSLTVTCKNWPSRYLGAYVQFFKQDGSVIKRSDISAPDPSGGSDFTWKDPLPSFIQSMAEPSDSKNYLTWISSGNAVFGVPVPFATQKTQLVFLWPHDASRAEVLLGGLGVAAGFKDWDSDVDIVGLLGTGLVNYGVGAISLVATAYVINPFIKALEGDKAVAFYTVAGIIGASALVISGIEYKTSTGKFILSQLAGLAASFIFGQIATRVVDQAARLAIRVLLEASAELVAELSAEEVLEVVPIAGTALRIASVASSIAALTATTVESVLSPATYKLEVLHTMNLSVTVKPDPAQVKPGFKPVWPLVSDHYVIQVKYPSGNNQEGGTTYTKAGPMPGQHDAPIEVTFDAIPAGGKIEVVANIYSENNWLAGQWNSGWKNAEPDASDAQSIGGDIKEFLVPLTSTTIYSQKQTLEYSTTDNHFWQVTKFSLDSSLATDFDQGGTPDSNISSAFSNNGVTLSANSSITINTSGSDWTLADNTTGVSYHVWKKQVYDNAGTTLYELEVQNITNPGTPLPAHWPLSQGSGSNYVSALQNLTYNNKEYQLGYAWQATGQNLPRDFGSTPDNNPMYAMQSISTLGQPEDQIIQPTRGFTNPSYITYDQFGLKPIFPLDISLESSLVAGPVPSNIDKEFTAFGVALPAGSQIVVVTANKEWTIGLAGQDPLYDLRIISGDATQTPIKSIGVFSWPIPSMDNFYLDSRPYTTTNPLYYLRAVALDTPPGQYEFDYDANTIWGAFTDITIQDMAVHPQGYVIAVDYQNHKMLSLKLPATAMQPKDAPLAMPLSGKGIRDGLMQNPQALTITADGRILILEQGNKRVQAFDVKGNPVSSFSVNQPSFTIAETFIGDLDNLAVPTTLLQAFQTNITPALAPIFTVDTPTAIVTDLDNSVFDSALLTEFVNNGYATSKNTVSGYTVTITTPGKYWLITDTSNNAVFDVRIKADTLGIDDLFIYKAFTLGITVRSSGTEWLIQGTTNNMTFEITNPGSNKPLKVQQMVSVMALRDQGADVNYLDIAVETKGFIYVLSVQIIASTPQFSLDIYNPDGSILLAKPQTGVNAAKIAVDQWRSLFTLNYNVISGPGGRTEPGISEWEPSTPPGQAPS